MFNFTLNSRLAAAAFGVWGVGWLVLGTRAVHGWTWARALATVAIASVPVALLALVYAIR